MTKTEFYNKLTAEQKRLHKHLEDNDYGMNLFEQDGELCAEVESWTNGGVDMIITLMPFNFDELCEWCDSFDIDEEIDIHRQGNDYCESFTIRESVEDFENWHNELKAMIATYKGMSSAQQRDESAQPESAQELTLKVYVKQDGDKTRFILGTNGKQIAYIENDEFNIGRYFGVFKPTTNVIDNATYPECVEFIGNCLDNNLNKYGINVEFVNE